MYPDLPLVRKPVAADVRALSDLAAMTFLETYAAFNTAEDMTDYIIHHFTVDILLKELDDKTMQYFIAEDNGEMAGYCSLDVKRKIKEIDSDNTLEISRIYVAKKYQGKKIGALLLNTCMQYGKENNFKYIWLGVWEKNENAISFYKHHGFNIIGTTSFILGSDKQEDHLMSKRLY